MELYGRMRAAAENGSARTKYLGGALGLIAGLLLGGVLMPHQLLTAPLTAVAGAAAATLTEYTLRATRRTTLLPLEGALTGCASGILCGVLAGMAGGLLYGLFLLATGGSLLAPLNGLYFAFETGAITGLVGLFSGFLLGLEESREQ